MPSFMKNVFQTFITRMILFFLGTVTTILIARVLGPTGRGFYAFLILIPFFLNQFGSLSLGSANVYFIGKKEYLPGECGYATAISGFLLGLIMLIILLLVSLFPPFYSYLDAKQIDRSLLWLCAMVTPFLMVFNNFTTVFQGIERFDLLNISNIFQITIQLILVIFLILIFKLELKGAIISYTATMIVSAFAVLYFFIKNIGLRATNIAEYLRKAFHFSWKLHISGLVFLLNYRLDMYLVAFFLGDIKELGIYSISVAMAEKIYILPSIIATVLFPRIASISISESKKYTPLLLRQTLVIVIILVLILSFFSHIIIDVVFGKGYLGSVFPFIILLYAIIFLSGARIISSDLSGKGEMTPIILADSTGLVFNFLLNILLIPRYGISGAAFATFSAYLIIFLIELIYYSRITSNSICAILSLNMDDYIFLKSQITKKLRRKSYKGQK